MELNTVEKEFYSQSEGSLDRIPWSFGKIGSHPMMSGWGCFATVRTAQRGRQQTATAGRRLQLALHRLVWPVLPPPSFPRPSVSATHVEKRLQEQGRLARPWATCTTQTALFAVHADERCVERHSTMSMDVCTVKRIICIQDSNRQLRSVQFVAILSWKWYCKQWGSHITQAVFVAVSAMSVWMVFPSQWMLTIKSIVLMIIIGCLHPSVQPVGRESLQ